VEFAPFQVTVCHPQARVSFLAQSREGYGFELGDDLLLRLFGDEPLKRDHATRVTVLCLELVDKLPHQFRVPLHDRGRWIPDDAAAVTGT